MQRSIQIQGDVTGVDKDWGGHVVISDTVEASGKLRAATLTMDNVELYNVGQKQTFNAGLRFDGAASNTHLVTNSVIHEGEGWGLSINNSGKVTIKDS